MEFKASYFIELENGKVKCTLCPHGCELAEGERGKCYVRKNIKGILYALTYGKVAAVAIDPIEKKPLYHFHPGSEILSIGGTGCNFDCRFCQNWHLIEGNAREDNLPPEKLIQLVRETNTVGIAYTYNEPFIWFEYIRDTAPKIKEMGYKVVLVTNGFINPKPFKEISPFIDAMNIDLKTMREDYAIKVCGGHVKPVLKIIEMSFKFSIHIEVTHLMVTDETDSEKEVEEIAEFLQKISPLIPLHISRYFPQRYYSNRPTPIERIKRALMIAKDKLHYVFAGNIEVEGGSHTLCPSCKNLLVWRRGYLTRIEGITKDKLCSKCGRKVDVIL